LSVARDNSAAIATRIIEKGLETQSSRTFMGSRELCWPGGKAKTGMRVSLRNLKML